MINKFEALGIFASIACMVLALFLLRVEATPTLVQDIVAQEQSAAVVAVEDSSDVAVRDALVSSLGESGVIEKMIVDDVILGYGTQVADGDTVTVHYIGSLQNGQQFDNSYIKGVPFSFTVGAGEVIEGWDMGLIGMQKEGKRILVIPPELAYGQVNVGPIPANATLVFAIELISID